MRLIKRDSLMSWNSLKESRTLHRTEYVDWAKGSYLFTVDDILDPLTLLERLLDQENPLSKFLSGISSNPIVEIHDGYSFVSGDMGTLSAALDQAIDALKQASQDQSGVTRLALEPMSVTLVRALNCLIEGGLIYNKEHFAGVNLSEATQILLERSPDGETLILLNRLLLGDAYPQEIRKWPDEEAPPTVRLIFVSHRWITPRHPDPDGTQLRELQRRLEALRRQDSSFREALVFYDYSSIFQAPRTDKEDAEFNRDLESLRALSQTADSVIILSEGYSDYKNRGWCFFEIVVAEQNTIHLFEDQGFIEDDIAFSSGLMVKPSDLGFRRFVHSQKGQYKVVFSEVEAIIVAFQHLSSCKTTDPEDVPRIRLELVRHFNSRETSAFGKLITAFAKFFEVDIVVASLGRNASGPIVCKSYFQDEEWRRLPVPGREQLSKFTVPPEKYHELCSEGYMPILRLTIPGVSDFGQFLQRFRQETKWRDYVVNPQAAANLYGNPQEEQDCFPTIDHVIHTVLERPPGFMLGPQCLYVPITPELEKHLFRKL